MLLLLPVASARSTRWQARANRPMTVGLELLFFMLLSVFCNLSLRFTTASRRHMGTFHAAVADDGVLQRLPTVHDSAIRSNPITFTGAVMGIGAVCLIVGSGLQGGYAPVADFGWARWPTIGYPGLFGGAIGFLLWAYALAHTTPTRVSAAVTVNPIVAGIVGAVLLNEPLRWNLVIGLLAVLIGIWIATSNAAPARRSSWPPSGVQGGAPVPRATRESKPRLSVAAECSCAPQQVTRSADAAPSRCNA